MIKNGYWSSCDGTHYFCRILKKPEFSQQIFKKYSNFMKICPVGAGLFHMDGQTDTKKLTAGFCNFANKPTNGRKATTLLPVEQF